MPHPFANLEGLLQLSRSEGVDIRPSLLRVLTDLYVQEPRHRREEAQQYLELALRLIPVVDAATRAAVDRKLRIYPHTPQELLMKLSSARSADGAEPAEHVSSQASAPAPAPFPGAVSREVALTPDPSRAQSAGSLGTTFLQATSQERWLLLGRLDEENEARPYLLEVRAGTVERLEQAALQRNQREFARELQQALVLSGRIAWQIVLDEFGETILVVARALGLEPDVVLRILMFLNPTVGESVERVFALIRSYDQLTLESAMAVVTSWQHTSRLAPTAAFQPLHAPDSAPSLDSARENARRAGPRGGEQTAPRPTPALPDRVHRTS